jgi:hypothetical protein
MWAATHVSGAEEKISYRFSSKTDNLAKRVDSYRARDNLSGQFQK